MPSKVRFIMLAVIAIHALSAATSWHIYSSFPAPAPNARGIFYSSGSRYILCDGTPPRLWRYDGGVSIDLQIPTGAWGCALYTNGNFVVTNNLNSYIYTVTTAGSLVGSFHCPKDHPADISKRDTGNNARYVAIPDEDLAIEMTTTGSIVSSFAGLGTRMSAIDADAYWRGAYGDPANHRVCAIDYGAGVISQPYGLLLNWASGSPPYDTIYVVDGATNYIYHLGYGVNAGIFPASLSRVKAMLK